MVKQNGHLLDKTLILSKPAIHRGEESTEDNLPKEKENNIKGKYKRKRNQPFPREIVLWPEHVAPSPTDQV